MRLRRRKDVAKSEFLRTRRSGDWTEVADTSTDNILFGPLGGRQWGVEGEESREGRGVGGRSVVSDGEEMGRRRRRDAWRTSVVEVTDFGPIDGPPR